MVAQHHAETLVDRLMREGAISLTAAAREVGVFRNGRPTAPTTRAQPNAECARSRPSAHARRQRSRRSVRGRRGGGRRGGGG